MNDYEAIAASLDEMRELLRAIVAGLMEDGFSDAQARELTVAIFNMKEDAE